MFGSEQQANQSTRLAQARTRQVKSKSSIGFHARLETRSGERRKADLLARQTRARKGGFNLICLLESDLRSLFQSPPVSGRRQNSINFSTPLQPRYRSARLPSLERLKQPRRAASTRRAAGLEQGTSLGRASSLGRATNLGRATSQPPALDSPSSVARERTETERREKSIHSNVDSIKAN